MVLFPHILGESGLTPKIFRFLVQRHTPCIYALISVFHLTPTSVILDLYTLVFHAVSLLHQFIPSYLNVLDICTSVLKLSIVIYHLQ